MTLSNISKNHLEKLLKDKCNDIEQYRNKENLILQSTTYTKLDVLFKQLDNIKQQIREVVNDGIHYDNLNNVKCSLKKVPGTIYHLYHKVNIELKEDNDLKDYYFSIISPEEWNTKDKYIDSYLYNLDGSYQKIEKNSD